MLARLTMRTARLLDVHFESSGLSTHRHEDDENALIIDLYALRVLLPPIPDNALHRVAAAYSTIAPICTNVHHMINNDVDNIAQLMLDLELRHNANLDDALPVGLLESPPNGVKVSPESRPGQSCPNERPRRKRRRSSDSMSPIVIPSTHHSTPTIIITLASPQPRETSCCIPYQDYAFGNLLTVPSHSAFNKIHPPMVLDQCSSPRLDNWKWTNGHWEAILPTLKEQAKRGMFSRPITSRRKKYRTPGGAVPTPAVQAR